MEKKVKPMATLLPRNNDILRKGVCQEPMLREPGKIGHVFNKDTMDMLQVGSGDFLLEEEKDQFKRILQRHGKAFAFSHTWNWLCWPKHSRAYGYLYYSACSMELSIASSS